MYSELPARVSSGGVLGLSLVVMNKGMVTAKAVKISVAVQAGSAKIPRTKNLGDMAPGAVQEVQMSITMPAEIGDGNVDIYTEIRDPVADNSIRAYPKTVK
jgi:predicted ATP-dependent protease